MSDASDRPAVLVVAGEPSGDRIAAGAARLLSARGVTCLGMGGEACAKAGVRLVAEMRPAAMGLTEVAGRWPDHARAWIRLARIARAAPLEAALLVDHTEFNWRLGRYLRGRGVPVLWCVAPQVWAWRPGRLHARSWPFDRLAVILPFEETLWRDAGADARYVGHPALDAPAQSKDVLRASLGLSADRHAVALLPGSRAHEVRRLAPAMLRAVGALEQTGRAVEARIGVAPWLDASTRTWLRREAAMAGVATFDVDAELGAMEWLAAFDASVVASGTATIEAALAGAPPVIVYRVSRVTAAIGRRLVRVPSIGLPNVLLGHRAYPELLQDLVEPKAIALAVRQVLDDRTKFADLRERLRVSLAPPSSHLATSAERTVARMDDWLGARERASDRTPPLSLAATR